MHVFVQCLYAFKYVSSPKLKLKRKRKLKLNENTIAQMLSYRQVTNILFWK